MGNAVCYDGSVYPTNKLYTFDDTPEPYKIEEIWPRWCIRNPLITPKIASDIRDSWEQLTAWHNTQFVVEMKIHPTITPLEFFIKVFYNNFFRLDKHAFLHFKKKGIAEQTKIFGHIIKFVVEHIEDTVNFEHSLVYVATLHNRLSIHPMHYTLMGLALMQAVKTCLGDLHSEDYKFAWTMVYSRMMGVMVPIAASKAKHLKVTTTALSKYHKVKVRRNSPDNSKGGVILPEDLSRAAAPPSLHIRSNSLNSQHLLLAGKDSETLFEQEKAKLLAFLNGPAESEEHTAESASNLNEQGDGEGPPGFNFLASISGTDPAGSGTFYIPAHL